MWLTLDIGNSALKGCFFEGTALQHPFRIPLHRGDDSSAWQADLDVYLRRYPVTRTGMASVVPDVAARVQASLRRLTDAPTQVIHYQMRFPFTLAYETPHTMGTDRLAVAAGAWVRYGRPKKHPPRPVVVLDAGTAINYEVIDARGVFQGGAIAPGPQLINQALTHGTAQLPPVPLQVPSTPIGRSTQEALQVGIMFTFIESVRGLLQQISDALETPPVTVATGGWSALLKSHLSTIDLVDPYLVLHGIREVMALNEPER